MIDDIDQRASAMITDGVVGFSIAMLLFYITNNEEIVVDTQQMIEAGLLVIVLLFLVPLARRLEKKFGYNEDSENEARAKYEIHLQQQAKAKAERKSIEAQQRRERGVLNLKDND